MVIISPLIIFNLYTIKQRLFSLYLYENRRLLTLFVIYLCTTGKVELLISCLGASEVNNVEMDSIQNENEKQTIEGQVNKAYTSDER